MNGMFNQIISGKEIRNIILFRKGTRIIRICLEVFKNMNESLSQIILLKYPDISSLMGKALDVFIYQT